VIKTEQEKDLLLKNTQEPLVLLEVSSSSFGEEKVNSRKMIRITFHSHTSNLFAGRDHLQTLGVV
jgi:hypothetical protein